MLAASVFNCRAVAQTADPNPWKFEKKAYKPDGTAWTGPAQVGDIIKYVLSYRPGASNSGPVTIKDTLSANLTFVAPIKAESKWTWTTPPYPAGGNTTTYSHLGFGPGLSVTIDVPTGFAGTPTSNGDGFFPIPVGGDRLYGIYHHRDAGSAQIMC
jgi:hypothetical protein